MTFAYNCRMNCAHDNIITNELLYEIKPTSCFQAIDGIYPVEINAVNQLINVSLLRNCSKSCRIPVKHTQHSVSNW